MSGIDDLYRALSGEIRKRDTLWLRLKGVAVDRVDWHGAFQRHVERLLCERPGGECKKRPRIVFDWSSVESTSAEGLAFFALLADRFYRRGHSITVCQPSCIDVRDAVSSLGLESSLPDVEWISDPPIKSHRMRTLGAPGLLGEGRNKASITEFLRNLRDELEATDAPRARVDLAEAIAIELVQNVRSHASPAWGMAVAVLEEKRRPPRVQIGFADTGGGIANHVLQQFRHNALAAFSDMTVVAAVLAQALSGRNSQGGGGFSRLARDATATHAGTVWVRSGTALVQLRETNAPRGARLTAGFGTQVRVTLPLRDSA